MNALVHEEDIAETLGFSSNYIRINITTKIKRGSWGRNARVEREAEDTEKDTVEDEEEAEKEDMKKDQ